MSSRKKYILKTWVCDEKESETPIEKSVYYQHSTALTVYIAKPPFDKAVLYIPYITTSRPSAWRFKTKKEAKKWAKFYGGCYIDCFWE